jgi:hypothetical protein
MSIPNSGGVFALKISTSKVSFNPNFSFRYGLLDAISIIYVKC